MHGATGPVFSSPVTLAAANGQTLVTADAQGRKIRLLALFLSASAAGTVTIHDNAGTPVILSGAMNISAAAPIELQPADYGWGTTTAGYALEADASVAATGVVLYQLVN